MNINLLSHFLYFTLYYINYNSLHDQMTKKNKKNKNFHYRHLNVLHLVIKKKKKVLHLSIKDHVRAEKTGGIFRSKE